ncbi:gamma-aminobutyric acid type B receptor subunit 2 [Schistocerca americana]|uniref:gamma-aminobutyric acid type B receptor subunit 2 n=1 Tax=Schistocerca americana TaxID=7009 RepID=UPI001F4F47FE|nr:gamma-aminobutyric acid type B receptor subunit 2 [Schistocerca americana]
MRVFIDADFLPSAPSDEPAEDKRPSSPTSSDTVIEPAVSPLTDIFPKQTAPEDTSRLFTLKLVMSCTHCDPGVGVDAFFHALYTQNSTRTVMLLGSACSDVTESLAKVVPYWNIVQVSFGSTSPALSDRKEFPLFYRTVAPDSSHNPARLAFVRGFGWDTVAALSQNEDVYSLAVNDLVTELEQANITCSATITFAESDFEDQMRMLRDLDTRIIIGSFSQQVAPKIFCEAYQLGMFGGDYAWILQGGPDSRWWRNASAPCPPTQLAAAVEGLLLVSSHNRLVGSAPAISGMTNAHFVEEFSRRALPVSPYAPQTYDAVWAIALTLRAAHRRWAGATTVRHFDYSRRDMAQEFLRQMGRLSFLGVSGPVSFSGADRVGISAFYQVQGGEVVTVALFDPATGALDFGCPGCGALAWQGGQVPVARREFRLRVVTIEPAAFLSVACLAVVGISLAVAFLAFNLHFRKLKYIKLSSPRLNNMAVVGCILVYTAVILLGLDHATLPASTHFPAVCTARVYLLSAGFSLAFGSMFTKTYRVHRIFTRSRSGVVKNKLLQDTQLISLICVLLLIDGLIVTLWVIVDPIQRHLRNLTLEISASDRSVVYQPQVEVCRSQYTHSWLGALYAYKGLLLVVGVYMAWETRHVKIPALNDSQYIGMSVYSVVITSGIVVVLANLISERATLAFVTITALILTSTTATLCLLFLPKMLAILGRAAHADPIVESMGLKIECNTRRFVTDDRRELYYRVEVQNRVYRREMAALDLEIGRLKRQLFDSPAASSAGSTSSVGTKRGELSPLEATALARLSIDEAMPNPAAGVGGGLPLLLLSVLPPVIPRASWPSADRGQLPMRRQVTFSSEPKLDDNVASAVCSQPAPSAHGDYDDVASFDHDGDVDPDVEGLHGANRKQGVFGRIWSFLGSSRPSSRKASATSFSGGGGGAGIASALRLHMGYLSGLVAGAGPGAHHGGSGASTLSHSQCALGTAMVPASSRELHPLKKLSSAGIATGGSGPIISVTSNDDADADADADAGRRKFSLGMCLSRDLDGGPVGSPCVLSKEALRRASAGASPRPRAGIHHQHSQPNLPFRERAKGSPRFPHRVVPTCSLTALDSRRKSSRADLLDKCRSLEDARSFHCGSAAAHAAVHQVHLPPPDWPPNTPFYDILRYRVSGSNWKPRAASYSPNCDVWGTAEFGIPLSELANSNRGRDRDSAPNVKD